MTIPELQLALASLKCPKCEGTSVYSAEDDGNKEAVTNSECSACHGSGFLLEGVREKCPGEKMYANHIRQGCYICQGRGWIPSTDLFKYAEALKDLWGNDVRHDNDFLDIGWAIFQGPLAFYTALTTALGVKV